MNRFTAFVFCVLLSVTTLATAQLSPETSPKASAQPASDAVPKHCYALNYVLKELDGSKVINSRSYVLNTHCRGHARRGLDAAPRREPRAGLRSQPGKGLC